MKNLCIIFLSLIQFAYGANFYASQELQDKYPGAFATQGSNLHFHHELENTDDRESFINELRSHKDLYQDLLNFDSLDLEKQVQVLRTLFAVEINNLKITPPELIIDEHSIPGWAFFEFDVVKGGAGKVYLNKAKLRDEKNKSEFIMLLIHETRHSAQFQLAQKYPHSTLGRGYMAAFKAQKEMKNQGIKTSFCDFMLLLNEYEAFQFANYIHGALTNFQTPINDMGTLASQYDSAGQLRLNILDIFLQTQLSPLDYFNKLETTQYEVLYE